MFPLNIFKIASLKYLYSKFTLGLLQSQFLLTLCLFLCVDHTFVFCVVVICLFWCLLISDFTRLDVLIIQHNNSGNDLPSCHTQLPTDCCYHYFLGNFVCLKDLAQLAPQSIFLMQCAVSGVCAQTFLSVFTFHLNYQSLTSGLS